VLFVPHLLPDKEGKLSNMRRSSTLGAFWQKMGGFLKT